MATGLVTSHTQAVDSAFVKANASLDSLCAMTVAPWDTVGRKRGYSGNKIHYSPAVPDARNWQGTGLELERTLTTYLQDKA